MFAGIMDESRLGPVRFESSWTTDGSGGGDIVFASTVWDIREKRGERVDGSVGERPEDGTSSWEKPGGDTSTAGLPLTGRAGATVA